jgi:hypothetical protein
MRLSVVDRISLADATRLLFPVTAFTKVSFDSNYRQEQKIVKQIIPCLVHVASCTVHHAPDIVHNLPLLLAIL